MSYQDMAYEAIERGRLTDKVVRCAREVLVLGECPVFIPQIPKLEARALQNEILIQWEDELQPGWWTLRRALRDVRRSWGKLVRCLR